MKNRSGDRSGAAVLDGQGAVVGAKGSIHLERGGHAGETDGDGAVVGDLSEIGAGADGERAAMPPIDGPAIRQGAAVGKRGCGVADGQRDRASVILKGFSPGKRQGIDHRGTDVEGDDRARMV